MAPPNSVLRKYTPPTCTLEISAKDSPLSRWVGQSVLKHLRFKLSFDDPRVSEEHWITVRGDRVQLESLCQVVTTYVQQFLTQSTTLLKPEHFSTAISQTSNADHELDRRSSLSVLSRNSELPASETSAGISIQPKGLLSHELCFGTLANEDVGASIRLSAVQLADLATALDDYAAEVTALPNLNRPSWLKNSPQWTSIAATFLIGVGLTTTALRLLDRPVLNTADTPTSSQGASSSDQRLALQPLPSASPSPLALPTAPPPLSSLPPLTTSPGPSSGDLPRIPVPPATQTTPPKIKIVEPPEGSMLVNPIPNQAASGSPSQDLAPPSIASARARNAPADAEIGQLRREESSQNSSPETTASSKDSTAFDTIPQVAEARQYFKQRWTPPTGLSGDLEYRLVLNPDGSVRQNLPLNEAAGLFLDRPEVGMPLYNAPFVSPLKNGRTAVIRVVLSQDGTVKILNESGQ